MTQAAIRSNRSIPIRPGAFPFGNLREFKNEGLFLFEKAARDQGDIVRLGFGPNELILISHPDGIQHVLQTNNRNYCRRSYANNLVRLITGLNLFTSDGDYWLGQRRLMQPAFHRRRIENFGSVMHQATMRMLERWQPAIENHQVLNMHDEMVRLTMEVVGKALFSVDLTDETSVLGKSFLTSTQFLDSRFRSPISWPLFIPTPDNIRVNRAIKDIRAIIQQMIDERRTTGIQHDDLLAMLMEMRDEETGEGMTDEQLRNETGIVIGAGQETTSNLLTWVFHILSKYPDIEKRVLKEIDEVLDGNQPTLADVGNLTYLGLVIDEALRIYPPAWALSNRTALENDEVLGYQITKGDVLFIVPYVVHRDSRFWKKPEEFIPERFIKENLSRQHKFAYLPFGGGPRKCIGDTFALIETKLVLATLLQKVQLRTVPGFDVVVDPAFTLRVKGGLPMHVRSRSNK